MRLLLGGVICILFTLQAQAAEPANGSLFLSWQELSRLNADKRQAYLEDLTRLLITLEAAEAKTGVARTDGPSAADVKELIAQMMRLMAILPTAHAEEPAYVPIRPQFDEESRRWSCPRPDLYRFEPSIGTCTLLQTKSEMWGMPEYQVNRFAAGEGCREEDAPETHVSVPARFGGGTAYCVPQESWVALPPHRRDYLTAEPQQTLSYDFFRRASPERQKREVLGDYLKDKAKADEEARIAAQRRPPPVAPAATAGPGAPPASCEPIKLRCEGISKDDRDKLTKAFYDDESNNHCVVGGFVSEYRKSGKRRGNCAPVTAVRANGESVTSTNLSKEKDIQFSINTCKNIPARGKRALCNPALFCLGAELSDGLKATYRKQMGEAEANEFFANLEKALPAGEKPLIPISLCVPVDQNMTKNCLAQFNSYVTGSRTLGGPGQPKPKACSGAQSNAIAGLAPSWKQLTDDLEKKFKKMCVESGNFSALFCDECEVMKKQITAMNKAATGTACRTPTGAPASPPPAAPAPKVTR